MLKIDELKDKLKGQKLRTVKTDVKNHETGHKEINLSFNFYNRNKLKIKISKYMDLSVINMFLNDEQVEIG